MLHSKGFQVYDQAYARAHAPSAKVYPTVNVKINLAGHYEFFKQGTVILTAG